MLTVELVIFVLVRLLTLALGTCLTNLDRLALIGGSLGDSAASLQLSLLLFLGYLSCFLLGFQCLLNLELILQIRIFLNWQHLLDLFNVKVVFRRCMIRAGRARRVMIREDVSSLTKHSCQALLDVLALDFLSCLSYFREAFKVVNHYFNLRIRPDGAVAHNLVMMILVLNILHKIGNESARNLNR